MGQIIGRTAKPDACNLRSLSSFGIPAAGQHILVSTDISAMQNGQGNFDCYIVGDGTKAATALPLKEIVENTIYKQVEVSTTKTNFINSYGKWQQYFGGYWGVIQPLEEGKKYKISTGNNTLAIAILKSNTTTPNTLPDYSSAHPAKIVLEENSEYIFSADNESKYLFVFVNVNSVSRVFTLSEGVSLKDMLVDVADNYVSTEAQSFTDLQMKQARANLGLGDGTIDDVPTIESDNIVKSGGVASEINSFKLDVFGQEKNYIEDKLLNYNGNQWNFTGGGVCTTHIPCSQGDVINYYVGYANAYLCVYDANNVKKEHLVSAAFVKTLTVSSEDASYLLFSFFLSNKEDVYVTVNGTKYVVEDFHQGLLPDIDDVPTKDSNGLAKSGGIYVKIENLAEKTTGVVDVTNWYQGNILDATGKYNSTTIRVTTAQPINKAVRVICSGDVMITNVRAYKDGKTPIEGGTQNTDWKSVSPGYVTDYIYNYNSNFPNLYFTFHRSSDSSSAITAEDVSANVEFILQDSIQAQIEKIEPQGNATYYGRRFDLNIHNEEHQLTKTVALEHYASEHPETVLNQSMAIFNNRYFCINDTTSQNVMFVIIDMETNEVIETVGMPAGVTRGHYNGATFTNVKYEPNDAYPLLLVSNSNYANVSMLSYDIYVIRIEESEQNTFTMTLVKTINAAPELFRTCCMTWEYDASRNFIWGHLSTQDWRWGYTGRSFNYGTIPMNAFSDTEYVCVAKNDAASVPATITIKVGSETRTVNVNEGDTFEEVFQFVRNPIGYSSISVNQSASAYTGLYRVFSCDKNGNKKRELTMKCAIVGFACPDLLDGENISISDKDFTEPVWIDMCIFQAGCCANGKLFLPVGGLYTANRIGIPYSNNDQVCIVVDPISGEIENYIPTGKLENEGCAIYQGSLYISAHNGAATAQTTTPSFVITKYSFK